MHMSSDLQTNLLFAVKESSLQDQRRNNANDSFGKGFQMPSKPFNDWALSEVTAEVPLAFSPK